MKKKINLTIAIVSLSILALLGCENVITRQYGGTTTINLPPNTKLVNITWKESNIWYLTRPMNDGEKAESYKFVESSTYGVAEGTVVINETVKK